MPEKLSSKIQNIPPVPTHEFKKVTPEECPPYLRIKKPKKKKVKKVPLAKLVYDPKTGIPLAPPLPYKLPPLPKQTKPALMKMNTVVPKQVKLVEPK